MIKKSKYIKYMTESYIYEAEEFKARSKESGKIVYYKTKDAMDAAIKGKKAEPIEKGGEEKPDEPKAEPKTTAISKTGGLGGGDDEEGGEEPSGEEPSGEEKPSAWSQKAQRAKDDLEQLSDPDEIGDWIEDNKWSLSGGKLGRAADLEFAPVQKAYAELEDAYMEGDWDVYDKAKEDFTKLTNQKLDSQKVSRSRRTGNELNQETLTIDGKQYRRISESIDKRISVKEVRSWLKGLEEFRYRKIPGVDARRITSFVNNGLSETDLPASLQKKWGNAKYSREKHLADKFVKERISKKLTQTESNHPLKEQYNKLFKNKVVL